MSRPLKSFARLARLGTTLFFVVLFWAVPRDAIAALPTICVFKRFAGIECYGCGMTRAIHAFVHGDVASAFAHNALVLPLALAAAVVCANDGVRLLRSSRRRRSPDDI